MMIGKTNSQVGDSSDFSIGSISSITPNPLTFTFVLNGSFSSSSNKNFNESVKTDLKILSFDSINDELENMNQLIITDVSPQIFESVKAGAGKISSLFPDVNALWSYIQNIFSTYSIKGEIKKQTTIDRVCYLKFNMVNTSISKTIVCVLDLPIRFTLKTDGSITVTRSTNVSATEKVMSSVATGGFGSGQNITMTYLGMC